MNKRFIFYFTLILIFNYPIKSFSSNKIVFLDMNKVLNNSDAGKYINDELKKKDEIYRKNIKELENSIKKDDEDISAKKNLLNQDELNNKITELNNKIKKYQEQVNNNRKDLETLKIKYTKVLLEKLKPILSDYSKKNSVSLIIDKKNIVIGINDLNITDDIIKILDNNVKKIDIQN